MKLQPVPSILREHSLILPLLLGVELGETGCKELYDVIS